jgi:Raffinose synthase or seed imbibition protein Sip1
MGWCTLLAAGVSGVKVDCQAGIGLMGSKRGGGPAVAAAFHGALEDSIRTHFPGNHAINCMAHSTENIYRYAAWRCTRGTLFCVCLLWPDSSSRVNLPCTLFLSCSCRVLPIQPSNRHQCQRRPTGC